MTTVARVLVQLEAFSSALTLAEAELNAQQKRIEEWLGKARSELEASRRLVDELHQWLGRVRAEVEQLPE